MLKPSASVPDQARVSSETSYPSVDLLNDLMRKGFAGQCVLLLAGNVVASGPDVQAAFDQLSDSLQQEFKKMISITLPSLEDPFAHELE